MLQHASMRPQAEPVVALRQEEEAEWKVAPLVGKHSGDTSAHFVNAPRVGSLRREFAQGAKPALG